MNHANFLRKMNHANFLRKMYHANFLRKIEPCKFSAKNKPYKFSAKNKPYKFSAKNEPCKFSAKNCPGVSMSRKPTFDYLLSFNVTIQWEHMREKFLQNLRLHLIDLSRRLKQDPSDDVADDVLYRLQEVASHLSRIAGSASGNVIEDVQHSFLRSYVPVNSKTAHPPRAIPGHLTRVKLRTVGIWPKMRPARWGIWLSCQNVWQRSEAKGFRNSLIQQVRRVHGSFLLSIPRGFFCCCRFI